MNQGNKLKPITTNMRDGSSEPEMERPSYIQLGP